MKLTWAFVNLFEDTQKEVEHFRTGFAGFMGAISVSQLVMNNAEIGLYIAITSGAINWLIGGFRC